MMKYEVTQKEYKDLMGYNSSKFNTCGDNCPVEKVSWHEAVKFANLRSAAEGLDQCFDCTGTGTAVTCSLKSTYTGDSGKDYYKCKGWCLLIEAEWEYAARAGTTEPRHGKLDDIAWYSGNSVWKTHAVGGKNANAWGLYDMLGNVFEWTYDLYGSYSASVAVDPVGASSGSDRVFRGGSWYRHARDVRSAHRSRYSPGARNYILGFRLVRRGP
jgi:formylglycine-generating enzyme required for sulfatase activity